MSRERRGSASSAAADDNADDGDCNTYPCAGEGEEVVGSLTPGQALVGVVARELTALMGGAGAPLNFATQPPAVILLAGLQGSGKTTTAAKLARLIKNEQKKKPLLVSTDVYRPAAIEQLQTLARQIGADFFPSSVGERPIAIAQAALTHARTHYHDALIVDTAGRLSIDEAMMKEIADLHAALHPIETLFIVDAMQGQDAVNTARAFKETLPLTGVILTKLDGDSRGGAALSVRHVTGAPIKFAGVSEKIDGLEPFHPDRMASRILGMGDVLSLIEEAHRNVDIVEAKKLAKKVKTGKGFDLDDYKAQIAQMRKMGGISAMLDKLPAEAQKAGQPLQQFVHTSIVDPNAYVEPGFPKDVMPPNFGQVIKPADLDTLVKYLIQSSKGGGK